MSGIPRALDGSSIETLAPESAEALGNGVRPWCADRNFDDPCAFQPGVEALGRIEPRRSARRRQEEMRRAVPAWVR
jgi:hypothetical protein